MNRYFIYLPCSKKIRRRFNMGTFKLQRCTLQMGKPDVWRNVKPTGEDKDDILAAFKKRLEEI